MFRSALALTAVAVLSVTAWAQTSPGGGTGQQQQQPPTPKIGVGFSTGESGTGYSYYWETATAPNVPAIDTGVTWAVNGYATINQYVVAVNDTPVPSTAGIYTGVVKVVFKSKEFADSPWTEVGVDYVYPDDDGFATSGMQYVDLPVDQPHQVSAEFFYEVKAEWGGGWLLQSGLWSTVGYE